MLEALWLVLLVLNTSDCSGPEVFVVVSQTGTFHEELANVTQERIRSLNYCPDFLSNKQTVLNGFLPIFVIKQSNIVLTCAPLHCA